MNIEVHISFKAQSRPAKAAPQPIKATTSKFASAVSKITATQFIGWMIRKLLGE